MREGSRNNRREGRGTEKRLERLRNNDTADLTAKDSDSTED